MYAVIVSGGKQYRVTEGDMLKVEKIVADEGATINIEHVLMVADGDKIQIGAPYLTNGNVTATVKSHGRGEKIKIVKMRRRKHYRKRTGHRQSYTELQITAISG